MRNSFAQTITALAEQDPRIVLLSGDIGNRLFDKFKAQNPRRFINCGVAEANMIGVAAGLALQGLRPVCYTIAPFLTYRCYEQIRIDLAYHNLPVVLVGTGGGLAYANLGPTHHSCEELGALRLFPNMTVSAAADKHELNALLAKAINHSGPTYIRIGKKGEPDIHNGPLTPLTQMSSGYILQNGGAVAVLACGTIAANAVAAAKLLLEKDIRITVVSLPTIKPLDDHLLEQLANSHNSLCTVEEHSRIGGLGTAVTEWLSEHNQHVPLVRLGTNDAFPHTTMDQDEARHHHNLTPEAIAADVLLC